MELCVSLERETSTKSVCVAVFIQRKNFLINLLHINVYVNLFSLFRKKKKDLEKFKLTLFCPKSNKYLISPSSITHESNIKIERLKEMTANCT